MMSDNASMSASTSEELTVLPSLDEIKTMLGREGIVWNFIHKEAPWFRGFWECISGLSKTSMKNMLGRGCHSASPANGSCRGGGTREQLSIDLHLLTPEHLNGRRLSHKITT